MTTVSIASLFNDKVTATVYGTIVDLKIGASSDFSSALTQGASGDMHLVKTSAVRVAGVCLPIKETIIVVGEGDPSDSQCGTIGLNERMWSVPLAAQLPLFRTEVTTLADLVAQSDAELHVQGLQVYFTDVTESGGVVSGTVVLNWEENIAGRRIVLIRQSLPFQIAGRTRVLERTQDIAFGIKVHVYADLYFELKPNRICVEVRARWPGGNLGNNHCQPF